MDLGGFCATTLVYTYTPEPGYTHFGSVRCCFGFRIQCTLTEQSYAGVSGTPYCPIQWLSASMQGQHPAWVWSSTPYTASDCTGGSAYLTYGLNGTSMGLGWFCLTTYTNGYTSFGSVR